MKGDRAAERQQMIHVQIEARGIYDERVLQAMQAVPRHLFVPAEEQARAYSDSPLPIGNGQTISQPYIVGLMTALLKVEPHHRVLEVGTGSGYQAAILAKMGTNVFSLDRISEFQKRAQSTLSSLECHVQLGVRDGYLGWPEVAPFDRIVVTAGAEEIPQALLEQLAAPGRMVIPIGPADDDQVLKVVTKHGTGRVEIQEVAPVRFVPMQRGCDETGNPSEPSPGL